MGGKRTAPIAVGRVGSNDCASVARVAAARGGWGGVAGGRRSPWRYDHRIGGGGRRDFRRAAFRRAGRLRGATAARPQRNRACAAGAADAAASWLRNARG